MMFLLIYNMIECFKIQLLALPLKVSPFDVRESYVLKRITGLSEWFCLNPTIIVADPFLFVDKDRLYLFYESKRLLTPGVIMMTSTIDLKHWTKPLVVLKEKFHLSFPWVFTDAGKVYMVPETGTDGSIRVYEATDDTLTRWKLKRKLIELPPGNVMNMGYSDSSIYKKDGIYYLMTTVQYEDDINTLELYYSDSLMGKYVKHPLSPIVHSQNVGRNAGSLQKINGKLYTCWRN